MIDGAGWIALAAACCFLCGRIAESRGRTIKAWVWLGAIFGPIALLVVALLPSRRTEATR
jgi:hypothetical protein